MKEGGIQYQETLAGIKERIVHCFHIHFWAFKCIHDM